MKIVNKCEINVFGLRRSGNHALINWFVSQYPGFVCYLNDIELNRNPFSTWNGILKNEDFNQFVLFEKSPFDLGEITFDIKKEREGHLIEKDCLVLGFEDKSIVDVINESPEREQFVGKSRKKISILILRDPFNLFSSRVEKGAELGGIQDKDLLVQRWKEYAREFLDETEFLQNKIVINYNAWVSSKEYRAELAKQLGFEFTDEGFESILPIGGGSSFDKQKIHFRDLFDDWRIFDPVFYKRALFNGKLKEYVHRFFKSSVKSTDMKVLDRWKKNADNPVFRSLFADPELVELSNRIFGEIPGTKILFD